jgi:hypothetical protein
MVTPMKKRLTTTKGAAHQCLSIGRKLPSLRRATAPSIARRPASVIPNLMTANVLPAAFRVWGLAAT